MLTGCILRKEKVVGTPLPDVGGRNLMVFTTKVRFEKRPKERERYQRRSVAGNSRAWALCWRNVFPRNWQDAGGPGSKRRLGRWLSAELGR